VTKGFPWRGNIPVDRLDKQNRVIQSHSEEPQVICVCKRPYKRAPLFLSSFHHFTMAPADDASSRPITSGQSRPLQREGAVILLTEAEKELEAAMLCSSPPPELSILGKRPRQQDDPANGGDTEPEDDPSTTPTQSQALPPSISNTTAASLCYARRKKLRADQHDELEVFLLVSPTVPLTCCSTWTSKHPGRI
jgi:hypothetical protein